MGLSPAEYIKDRAGLKRLVKRLMQEKSVAVDTESNSLHAYQEQVCLIQISTRDADFIIDPLRIDDMRPLGKIFADPKIETVFHAAEYDIMCMKRDFGYTFTNLFDTMIASRICGFEAFGLGNLIEQYAGVKLNKKHQRDNWGKRPLPKDSLRYAQMDTHYLLMLRDELLKLLQDMGRMEEAQEAFDDLCEAPAAERHKTDPDGFWKIGIPNRLDPSEMKVLRELYNLREELAIKRDRPPFKIWTNKVMVEIARMKPRNYTQLYDIRGISKEVMRRYGDHILDAVDRGCQAEYLPERPRHEPPDPIITERYTALHAWRKARAIARGVESDVIISKQVLWNVARRAPGDLNELATIEGMKPWRFATYGEEILDVLNAQLELEG